MGLCAPGSGTHGLFGGGAVKPGIVFGLVSNPVHFFMSPLFLQH